MPTRTANAAWNGNLLEGNGKVQLAGGAFQGQYNFTSRFQEGVGTNPEELLAAAEAACFSMALSADLGNAGYAPVSVETVANVTVEKVDGGFSITTVKLQSQANVPGITQEQLQEIANGTKKNCPVARALAAIPNWELTVTLVGE